MNQEIEIKYRVMSPSKDLNKVIKSLGLVPHKVQNQKDVYWDTDDFMMINLKRGLRIRYVNGKLSAIEFKSLFKNEDGEYFIEEIDLRDNGKLNLTKLKNILVDRLGIFSQKESVAHCDSHYEILGSFGLKPIVCVQKRREIYANANRTRLVCVDKIEGLPLYLEIESLDGTSPVDIALKFEKVLELEKTQASYLDLVFQSDKNILSKSEFDRKFEEDKRWNVQPNEESIVDGLLKNTLVQLRK